MNEVPAAPNGESGSPASAFCLGDWVVEPPLNRVSRGERAVHVRRQLMDLLVFLAAHAGQVVSKEEIFRAVWPGQFVAETGLARCISQLRDVFEDDPKDPRFIETIPTRGYRLVAPIQAVVATAAPAASAAGTPALTALETPSSPQAAADLLVVEQPAAAGPRVRWNWRLAGALAFIIVVAAAAVVWRLRPVSLQRNSVIIAFENKTGDAVFDGTLRLALSTQLEQSPYLAVVSEQRVREELGFMKRPEDTLLTRPVALDVCQRVGADAALMGTLAALGRHFVVGLEGVECTTGRVLAREQVEVDGKEGILDGLGRAASSIRKRLGESGTSIQRNDLPIAQATTSSLEALKAFSQGDYERARGRDEDAIRFLRRATELDPGFALAHLRLGLQLANLSRYGEAVESFKRAYAVADRASSAERLYITSSYYNRVLRDPLKAVEPLESWRDTFPRSTISRFSLAALYGQIGRNEDALREAEEAYRLDPKNALAASVRAESLMRTGHLADAKRLAEELAARSPAAIGAHALLFYLASLENDADALRRLRDWASSVPGATALLEEEYGAAAYRGQLSAAARFAERRAAAAAERGDAFVAASAGLDDAMNRVLAGQAAESVAAMQRALQRARTPETMIRAALVLALAGQVEEAERYYKEYQSMPDVAPSSDPNYRPPLVALVALHRGAPEAALDALAPLRAFESGWRFAYLPAYIRGQALLRLGRPAEAAAEYDRILKGRAHLAGGGLFSIHPLSWLQLARARRAAGDTRGAREAYATFLGTWKDADPDVPALAEARAESVALQ